MMHWLTGHTGHALSENVDVGIYRQTVDQLLQLENSLHRVGDVYGVAFSK